MSRQVAMWTLAALLGIVLTAGMTWATSRLTSQHIGISSEPISAGARLAPPTAERTERRRSSRAGRPSKARPHPAVSQGAAGSAQSSGAGQVPPSSQSPPVEQSSPSAHSTSAAPRGAAPATGTGRRSSPGTSSSSGDDHTDRGGSGETEGAGREQGGGSESAKAGQQHGRDD